jgi:predicted nicotinamide N-methyase
MIASGLGAGIYADLCDLEQLRAKVFGEDGENVIGSRLGIDFIKAQAETLTLRIYSEPLEIQQSHMGVLGISGVVWDCGLLMVDFLCTYFGRSRNSGSLSSPILSNVLDLGCGTGVCGLAALYSGSARYVTFTDAVISSVLDENIHTVLEKMGESVTNVGGCCSNPCCTVKYEWSSETVPDLVLPSSSNTEGVSSTADVPHTGSTHEWDAVLCSDVLYEQRSHDALMDLLMKLKFKMLLLSYKTRHEVPELRFFERLLEWCEVYKVDSSKLCMENITTKQLGGLYLFVIIRR